MIRLDPLVRLKDAHKKGIIPDTIYDCVVDRFSIMVGGIDRIEKASKMAYPIAYVEPSLVMSAPKPNSYGSAIFFARTIPIIMDSKFHVVIQISAPLLLCGLKGTIHAILAHEFLHYLELVRKIVKMDILSDEISGNIFENIYGDETRLFEPRAVFSDQTLLSHITKRFPAGFRDHKLETKVIKLWYDRGLPRIDITLDTNTTRISADSLAKIKFKPEIINKINELEQKSIKIRNRRLH